MDSAKTGNNAQAIVAHFISVNKEKLTSERDLPRTNLVQQDLNFR
jgi:hypothetical protein